MMIAVDVSAMPDMEVMRQLRVLVAVLAELITINPILETLNAHSAHQDQ